jgi:DNA-directed RNA polymerase specialized sigma24 family protein
MEQSVLFNNTPAERERLFIMLYKKAFPAIARYISKLGGNFEEAKDVFQDALVIYYERLVNGSLALKTNEEAYLTGIAKHLWNRKFKDNLHYMPVDDYAAFDIADDEFTAPSEGKLMHYLETAGQKCMDLLKAFYYDNLSADAIAGLFGYSGPRSATVQKFKCMEKVRETIKEKSLAYEDFID